LSFNLLKLFLFFANWSSLWFTMEEKLIKNLKLSLKQCQEILVDFNSFHWWKQPFVDPDFRIVFSLFRILLKLSLVKPFTYTRPTFAKNHHLHLWDLAILLSLYHSIAVIVLFCGYLIFVLLCYQIELFFLVHEFGFKISL
jgi:hypothetical protein